MPRPKKYANAEERKAANNKLAIERRTRESSEQREARRKANRECHRRRIEADRLQKLQDKQAEPSNPVETSTTTQSEKTRNESHNIKKGRPKKYATAEERKAARNKQALERRNKKNTEQREACRKTNRDSQRRGIVAKKVEQFHNSAVNVDASNSIGTTINTERKRKRNENQNIGRKKQSNDKSINSDCIVMTTHPKKRRIDKNIPRKPQSNEQRRKRQHQKNEYQRKRKQQNATIAKNKLQAIAFDMMNNESLVSEHSLGPLNLICTFCGAKHFTEEKPDHEGKYTMCCQKGKIKLPEQNFPTLLFNLMTNKDAHSKNFMENIRSINSSFAFASMGGNIATPPGFGPYCFRVHGQIYHQTGSFLHPLEGKTRKYAQLYILDNETATKERLAYKGNENCNKDLMCQISSLLTSINIFAKSYKMLHEVETEMKEKAKRTGTPLPSIFMAIKHDRSKDIRRYNAPKENEVAVVFEDIDGEPPFERDILVHLRPNPSATNRHITEHVSILHPNLDPMVYPLFFPWGERGWGPDLRNVNNSKRVSQMQYFSYKFQIRNTFNPILSGGKLTQQFCVDAYTRMEANRLNWIRYNQPKLRVESYSGLMDHLNNRAEAEGLDVGRTIILPSTFEGSPRNYQQRYQDAMAFVTKFGKPDLFITMTCNPKWNEITDTLEKWQNKKPEHRPDLVARVFKIKLDNLLKDIDSGLFGKVIAMVHVIEFQKRGLPHAHILVILDKSSKIRTEDEIDRYVSAEIPDEVRFPVLHNIVVKNMIHTPCGKANANARCIENGQCTKRFPKDFNNSTIGNQDGYPIYKRRDNIRITMKNGVSVDNRWVVPYNPYLLKKYNCHINVEICASIISVKYLFKYVYKGLDRSTVSIKDGAINHDEPKDFIDSRYVSAPEAMWRIFAFPMHDQSHAIIRLAVHLPREQTIVFHETDDETTLATKAAQKSSTLMAWFQLNKDDKNARKFLYGEIPYHYVFDKSKGMWLVRRSDRKLISRMYSVSVRDQERYFLRMLLLHVKGATCFEDLRKVNDVVHTTFKDAARAQGFLLDDNMWHSTLEDAVTYNMPRQLRDLFAYICVFGPPSDPRKLWDEFKSYMMEDFCHKVHQKLGDCNNCEGYALREIEDIFITHGTNCSEYSLPSPAIAIPDLDSEFNIVEEENAAAEMIKKLNRQQSAAFLKIVEALEHPSGKPNCFFLDGPGGSGKTFLYKTLIHYVRGKGMSVMPAATTGIAANLLSKGRTMHSLYGLPIPINESSVSRIKVKSKAADFIRKADLGIIDECTMASNYQVDTIDRLSKEVMSTKGNKITKAFGGKVMLFGGDFRQCLPVIPHAMRPAIVQGSMKYSKCWKQKQFTHLTLSENMRSVDPEYSEWLLNLGNGTLQSECDVEDDIVEIPSDMICNDIVTATFGDRISVATIKEMAKRAILCPKNDDVDKLNEKVLDILDGEYFTYLSDDSVKEDTQDERDNFNLEFLNSITPSGMPRHCLKLKVGAIIMLLRNLNTKRGLCNGTRLVVTTLKRNLIEAEVLTGSAAEQKVLIPRIDLCPSETGLPFILNRRQFPVKVAFAMTINKSQGQTMDKVGIYLPEPVFGHGQLYVAFSRVRQKKDVKVQVIDGSLQGKLLEGCEKVFTRNVVYREAFEME